MDLSLELRNVIKWFTSSCEALAFEDITLPFLRQSPMCRPARHSRSWLSQGKHSVSEGKNIGRQYNTTSFPGSFISRPGREMKEPGNEVEYNTITIKPFEPVRVRSKVSTTCRDDMVPSCGAITFVRVFVRVGWVGDGMGWEQNLVVLSWELTGRGDHWSQNISWGRKCVCVLLHETEEIAAVSTVSPLTLSLPRVINFNFFLQPHQKYYITHN